MGYADKAELVYGCLSWYFELGTDLVALFFLPMGLMVANLSAIAAAYGFTIFLYSQRGDPRQCCMAVFGLHILYDTCYWSLKEDRKHPSLFMMEFVDAVFRSPFSMFLQLTAIFDGEEGDATLILLISTLSSLLQEAKAQCEIENCEHLFRGQLENMKNAKAGLIVATRLVEIASRQLALAFVQSVSQWLGIVWVLCSAVLMATLTFFDPDSLPSSAVVNFFALPFVNVRGWTTDMGWKPVGLPRKVFYSLRFTENMLLVIVAVVIWSDESIAVWNRCQALCLTGIVCQAFLLPMVMLTTRFVQRDPKWLHPSARGSDAVKEMPAKLGTSVKGGLTSPEPAAAISGSV